MDLTRRQQVIFRTIVEQFAQVAEPIGSRTLIPLLDVQVSSATIRNEMAALEKMGLLEKTHTSSGRIPSLAGYRYYIENLMETGLDQSVSESLRILFTRRHYSIQELVDVSCSLLAEMTHLTSVVLGPKSIRQKFHSLQLIPISDRTAVCVLVTDQGHVQNRTFTFRESVSLEDLQDRKSVV